MFTGIIEDLGEVLSISKSGTNIDLVVKSKVSQELKIDQSISHNGVCLTVVECTGGTHRVTAIQETLEKTNLGSIVQGDFVNLERCMVMNGRIDGHIVQGHVDQIATVTEIEYKNGSWIFGFEYDPSTGNLTVEKGSICINGVSLTVVNSKVNGFSVAIIPYTYENTVFKTFIKGTEVNLEFDILGKYIVKMFKNRP